MTKLKSSDLKAISWYCEENNLIPQLSIPPTQMHFIKRDTRQFVSIHLDMITLQYNEWNKEEKKRRAAARKLAKKMEENAPRLSLT